MFEGFDFTDFWDDNKYALKAYVNDPPSDELIKDIEEELGHKLPASYIWLMKQHNGGIPVNTCFPTDMKLHSGGLKRRFAGTGEKIQ